MRNTYVMRDEWKRMSGKLNFLSLAQMNNYQNLFTVDYMNNVSQKLIILYNFLKIYYKSFKFCKIKTIQVLQNIKNVAHILISCFEKEKMRKICPNFDFVYGKFCEILGNFRKTHNLKFREIFCSHPNYSYVHGPCRILTLYFICKHFDNNLQHILAFAHHFLYKSFS